jgi:hypothetical protein
LFPVWAFARGLYVRSVIGTLAWYAVFNAAGSAHAGGPVILALCLHVMAGCWGQRWVVYKLLRTAEAADRAGLNPAERFRYIRRRRTLDTVILRWIGTTFGRWLVIAAVPSLARVFR